MVEKKECNCGECHICQVKLQNAAVSYKITNEGQAISSPRPGKQGGEFDQDFNSMIESGEFPIT